MLNRRFAGLAARVSDRGARFPVSTLAEISGGGDILVLAPHPDDESLGCGGTIIRAREEGIPVHLVIVSDGAASHPGSRTYPPERVRAIRRREVMAAARCLGIDDGSLHFLDLPDSAVPASGAAFQAACAQVVRWVGHRRIGAILTAWEQDPHCDHEATAALACALMDRLMAGRVLCYPVWGWTLADSSFDGVAGVRIDIADQLSRKRAAIACHQSQLGRVIDDDPNGTCLDRRFLAAFDLPYEVFLIP